jgi:hypothetical protein
VDSLDNLARSVRRSAMPLDSDDFKVGLVTQTHSYNPDTQ